MRVRANILLLSLLLGAGFVYGADRATNDSPPSMSMAAFPLPLKRTYLFSAAGNPAGKAELDTPFPNDFPPCLTVMLEDMRKFPSSKGRYYFPSRNVVRVFRVSQIDQAPYKTIAGQIKSLRRILAERPTEVSYEETVSASTSVPNVTARYSLPDYPPRNAGHVVEVKLSYVDAAWGAAFCYVTQFTQEDGTRLNNEELTYIVQGITNDNQFYLSADFSIAHSKLPNTARETLKRPKGDAALDHTLLSKQKEASFTPDLSKLRKWISALKFE